MTKEKKQKKESLVAEIKKSSLFNAADIIGIVGLLIGAVVYFFILKPQWSIWLLFFGVIIVIAGIINIITDGKPATLKNILFSFLDISLKLILELLFLCSFVPYLALCFLGRFLWIIAIVCALMVILVLIHLGLLHFEIHWLSPPPEMISLKGILLQLAIAVTSTSLGLLYFKIMGLDEDKPLNLFFGFWVKLYERTRNWTRRFSNG